MSTAPLAESVTIGTKFDVPELTRESVPLSAIADAGIAGSAHGPGDTLAVAACGLLGARPYYAGRYDGGTAYMPITDPSVPGSVFDVRQVPQVTGGAIAKFPHHPRLTVETYLGEHQLRAR